MVLGHNNHRGTETHTWYNCLIHSALSFNPLTTKNKSYITVKNGFCNLSGYKVFITYPNGSLDEHSCKCCDLILSLVQLLFSFVSILPNFFSEKAVLATQSSMCLHDNIKQIMFKFHTKEICACSHTLKGRWFKSLVYLNDFKLFNCA